LFLKSPQRLSTFQRAFVAGFYDAAALILPQVFWHKGWERADPALVQAVVNSLADAAQNNAGDTYASFGQMHVELCALLGPQILRKEELQAILQAPPRQTGRRTRNRRPFHPAQFFSAVYSRRAAIIAANFLSEHSYLPVPVARLVYEYCPSNQL
jgi:hypothetical protein